ncbi:hypothetical protein S7S_03925 [Isoalcanivorax pacificus W11-5]|uniref:STAS/SEC14 domain-containing protein n=1 Tax=Isoalcanivorax pacificus W11-5 TaxID=391936 RepID=A0A0B4XLE6_9GAMM|nr:STAS/SEC14 domain-containing protein [Isoalcanivorax pacificus]AJD47207.1 hypothetical protein S7S_03925 [Isoalcanivorax pacificus W11-5]
MITQLAAPGHVAAFRVSGTLTGDDIDQALAIMADRLATYPRISLYLDAEHFADITGEALHRYAPDSRLPVLTYLHRVAVITDRQWISLLTALAPRMLPDGEARTFGGHEQSTALRWVSDPA